MRYFNQHIILKSKLILCFLAPLLLTTGCDSNPFRQKTFYNTFSEDWRYLYEIIPLIEPFRLQSIDGGKYWHFEGDEMINNTIVDGHVIKNVRRFGISKNYFFGQDEKSFFFFDTQTGLYASYKTEEELMNCMRSLKIPITEIKTCSEYVNDIKENKRCYWFPENGEKYIEKLELKPYDLIDLMAYGSNISNADFTAPSSIKKHANNIYFFKLNIADKKNDLLYFGINWNSFILIKDSIVVPIFINTDSFKITLYTPFPIAQEKGISEKNRIHTQKTIGIEQ